jgi:RNA polymerase sigma factor (sigma-70 family)
VTPDAPGLIAAPVIDDLAHRFAHGDPMAFDQLVVAYHGRVTRLAQRLLGWPQDVEDITQEVFLSVLASQSKFRRQSSLWTWLTAITLNKCRSHRRNLLTRFNFLRRLASASASTAPSSDIPTVQDETAAHVRNAVATLPARDREVIILHYLEQRSTDEIATLLHLKHNAVEVRLHRARNRLKSLLGDHP